jgi:hypothetical protein
MRARLHQVFPKTLGAAAFLILAVVTVARGADGTSVALRIEGSATTLFDGTVTVTDCTVTDTDGVSHALSNVAACALTEAAAVQNFTVEFQNFGFGLFLKRLGADDTPTDFSRSWGFWLNDDPASTGVDTAEVAANDRILLAFSPYPGVPLRVTAPATPTPGSDAEFIVEKRAGEYDANFVWSGRWEPAAGATLHADETALPVPVSGKVTITLPNTDTLTVSADGEGFIRSARAVLALTAFTPSPAPTPSPTATPSPVVSPAPTPSPTPTPTPSPSPTAASISTARNTDASAALSFLRSRQGVNGHIDGDIVTAWSALAFGAHGERARAVRSQDGATLLDALAGTALSSATDLERQILAVRASGADPATFGKQNLLTRLKEKFHDGQIGETSLLNDDIFGVLALLAGGESSDSPEIRETVRTMLSRQGSDGSWDNLDITAAAIQALVSYKSRGGTIPVADALSRARMFLYDHRDAFGGFGENSATTSWGLQAIVALSENPEEWQTASGGTPWTALRRYQNSSGGFGWKSDADVSSFMTAYAVPALLGRPWPVTLLSIEELALEATALAATPSPSPAATRVTGAPTASASSSPRENQLAAADGTTQESGTSAAGSVAGAETASRGDRTPQPRVTLPVPVSATDRQFALTLFSISNMGIGVSVARLLAKIRTAPHDSLSV